MPTSSLLIITASVALLLLLPLCSAHFRKLRKHREYTGTDGVKMPSISVIVSAFDNPDRVLLKMASFLNQQYESDYEVILIVDNEKIKEESYQYQLAQLPNKERLRTTYVPDSSHYMGLQKLAVTLGVKAAKYDWIMLTDGHTEPVSKNWLTLMARNCFGKDIVLGYTNIAKEKFSVGGQSPFSAVSPSSRRLDDFMRFERHLWQLYNLRQAERGTAYSTAGGNMMFRKSMFMNGRGYQGNLKYTFGEYEFLVNGYATKDNVAVETHPDSWCSRDKYTAHEFDLYHRCFQETRKHLQRKWPHRLLIAADQAVLHLSFPAAFLMTAYAIYSALCTPHSALFQWIAAAVAFLALPCGLFLREWLARKSLKRFRIDLTAKLTSHFELYLLWLHFIYKVKYMRADKIEFISHKY